MTFNRLANIQFSRLKNKVLTDPLQEPTIPIIATSFQPITEEDYLVLGEFLETDILDGELVINTESDRVWVRSNDSIIELNTTTASGFRPLTTNHIWIGESGLAKEYNLGSGFLVGTNSVSVSGMSLTAGNGITASAGNIIPCAVDKFLLTSILPSIKILPVAAASHDIPTPFALISNLLINTGTKTCIPILLLEVTVTLRFLYTPGLLNTIPLSFSL